MAPGGAGRPPGALCGCGSGFGLGRMGVGSGRGRERGCGRGWAESLALSRAAAGSLSAGDSSAGPSSSTSGDEGSASVEGGWAADAWARAGAFLGEVERGGRSGVTVWQLPAGGGSRALAGEVEVGAPPRVCAGVLTDYERLPDSVPSLVYSARLPMGGSGGGGSGGSGGSGGGVGGGGSGAPDVRVLQRAEVGAGAVRLGADVVLDIWEDSLDPATGLGEVRFRQTDGSFASIEGRWVVEPHTFPLQPGQAAARLRFEALVEPGKGGFSFPDALARAIVDELLPLNVGAVARRAEALHREAQRRRARGENPSAPSTCGGESVGGEESLSSLQRLRRDARAGLSPSAKAWEPRDFVPPPSPYSYLGVHNVPIPGPEEEPPPPSSPGKDARRSWSSVTGEDASSSSRGLSDVEAHLRRLDDDVCFHHRVVASVPVQASARRVWAVLSDYSRLSDIVPCLEACDLLQLPPVARGDGGRARLRLRAGTSWGYARLLTEFTADVLEKPPFEMQFRFVQGELDSLQGKWLVEPGPEVGAPVSLRFALEMRVPRKLDRFSGPDADILQPLLERFSSTEVPKVLAAVRDEVEASVCTTAAAATTAGTPSSPISASGASSSAAPAGDDRTPLPFLLEDLELLELELLEFMGLRQLRQMPTRAELRAAGRQDLVKAVEGHGGFFSVADALRLRGSRSQERPRGYWQDLGNVQREVQAFQQENSLDPGVLPTHSQFTAADRSDMARMMRKHWGGQVALATTLGLLSPKGPAAKNRRAQWERHLEQTKAYTQAEKNSLWTIASETFISSMDQTEEDMEEEEEDLRF